MSSSLSNLVSNLSEGIHKSNVNAARTIKNGKLEYKYCVIFIYFKIEYKYCDCILEYSSSNKNFQQKLDEKLK